MSTIASEWWLRGVFTSRLERFWTANPSKISLRTCGHCERASDHWAPIYVDLMSRELRFAERQKYFRNGGIFTSTDGNERGCFPVLTALWGATR